MNEGWFCPRCGAVNAPFVTQCTCNYNNTTKTNDMSECLKGNHMWECCGVSTAGSTYICKVCGKTKTENYNVDKSNITISSR